MANITNEMLLEGMQNITKRLEDIERTPAKGNGVVKGRDVIGFDPNWRSDDWGKYKDLHYTPGMMDMVGGRKKRISGLGGCFVKMAAMIGCQEAMAIAKSAGMPSDYNTDKLEAEYGATTLVKAKEFGVPGWDRQTKKVLTNERRKTALAEGVGQTGGYTIPPQWIAELNTISAEEGFIEQRAKAMPMNTREVEWPMLDITTAQSTGTSPYFGGVLFQWQPEAAIYSATQPAFRQTKWTAWDLVGVTVSSNQLLADNGIGLDALLTQLFGQAITWYKEYAFLRGLGAGASMPLGVLNAPATILQTRAVPGHFKYSDAANMLAHCQIRSWDSACWVMHQSVMPELAQMVDNTSSNRLVWVNPMGDPGASNRGPASMKLPTVFFNGLPVYFTEKLPVLGTTGDVLLIDFSHYVIGNRMDMQIDVSPHVNFQTNQLMWRVITRTDGKPWLNSPLTDAEGWTISPMVALRQ